MKKYEKESFLKVFFIFFSINLILWSTIFLLYYKESRDNLEDELYYQMKDYTFNFVDDNFTLDIVKKTEKQKISKIIESKEGLILYLPMPQNDKFLLKVIYSNKKFQTDINKLKYKILKTWIIMLFIILIFSFYFARYSLKPMKNAINMLEVFLKDLIHDLNTPATSILLNSKLLSKKVPSIELERIEVSAKHISLLYKNLETLKNNITREMTTINVKKIIEEKVKILHKLYPNITIELNIQDMVLDTSENALSRILDNILTNACKYNKKNGKVIITTNKNQIIIEDTGIGIKNTKRVFERYYKENERGLGLGMNIVKRLCDELKIKIKIKSKIDIGTTIELTLN